MSTIVEATPVPGKPQKSAYERLPKRRKRFVDEVVSGTSGAEAARHAGYNGIHANVQAWKWAQRPEVKAAIEEREQQLAMDVGVRQHKVLRQMLAIATCDPRRVVDADGMAIPLQRMDEDTAAAISSVEVENISINGETGTRYKYRFWDKVKANDRLGQYTKLWDAKGPTLNVDARSVHINGHASGESVLRAVDDLLARAAAVGLLPAHPQAHPDGSVLPAAVCDGPAGRGSPVDVGPNPGSAE